MTYDTKNDEKNCGEASSRLIPPSLYSFLVSPLLATKVESWSRVSKEWTSLPCLIHRALREGDHFLRTQRPTRKSVQSVRSQSWFKRRGVPAWAPAFNRNKAILYNNNLRLQRHHSWPNKKSSDLNRSPVSLREIKQFASYRRKIVISELSNQCNAYSIPDLDKSFC